MKNISISPVLEVVRLFSERVQDLGEGPGDDPAGGVALPPEAALLVAALHGEGLPRAGLAVGKHRAVVSHHHLHVVIVIQKKKRVYR